MSANARAPTQRRPSVSSAQQKGLSAGPTLALLAVTVFAVFSLFNFIDTTTAANRAQQQPTLQQGAHPVLRSADPSQQTAQKYSALPAIVERQYHSAMQQKREKLQHGMFVQRTQTSAGRPDPFEDIEMSLPLPQEMYRRGDGQWVKGFASPAFLDKEANGKPRKCVVYGAGIANNSSFEEDMARKHQCEVHGFDCTVKTDSEVVSPSKGFTFHQVCIGKEPSKVGDTIYKREGASDSDYVFKRLPEVMAEQGHTYVDVLKFDIEGSEWFLLYDEIINGTHRPEQLLFELHTHYANPDYVPHHLVDGKHKAAVNRLFLDLFDIGYRVVAKDVNGDDPACAEFVLVRLRPEA